MAYTDDLNEELHHKAGTASDEVRTKVAALFAPPGESTSHPANRAVTEVGRKEPAPGCYPPQRTPHGAHREEPLMSDSLNQHNTRALAALIRAEMSKRGYETQVEVAADLGVTPATVSRWMRGSQPKPAQKHKLARWLDVPESTLGVPSTQAAERLYALEERVCALEAAQTNSGGEDLIRELQALTKRYGGDRRVRI